MNLLDWAVDLRVLRVEALDSVDSSAPWTTSTGLRLVDYVDSVDYVDCVTTSTPWTTSTGLRLVDYVDSVDYVDFFSPRDTKGPSSAWQLSRRA